MNTYSPLTWYTFRRFERIRVVAWTCHEHRVVSYELCESAGLSFIQRTNTGEGKTIISRSEAWPCAQARIMWAGLLSGAVR